MTKYFPPTTDAWLEQRVLTKACITHSVGDFPPQHLGWIFRPLLPSRPQTRLVRVGHCHQLTVFLIWLFFWPPGPEILASNLHSVCWSWPAQIQWLSGPSFHALTSVSQMLCGLACSPTLSVSLSLISYPWHNLHFFLFLRLGRRIHFPETQPLWDLVSHPGKMNEVALVPCSHCL